jgi:hypothetical protein
MTRVTAGQAMQAAQEAKAEISAHERECAIRYQNIQAAQEAQREALDSFKADLAKANKESRDDNKWIMRWIIATLLAAVSGSIGIIFVLAAHGH